MLSAVLAAVLLQSPTPPPVPLDYDRSRPIALQPLSPADRQGVTVKQIAYERLDGTRNAATLVLPPASATGSHAAILYLHWYEPPKPSSNRTEFLAEAIELASLGTTSLLIDTPWRVEGWFASRDGNKDYDFSVHEAKEVRRALDVLLAQPSIDPRRVAIVGHDFGAMYGALAAAADRRVTHLVYMAGNGSMGEWFLFPRTDVHGRARPRGLDQGAVRAEVALRRGLRHAVYLPDDFVSTFAQAPQRPRLVSRAE